MADSNIQTPDTVKPITLDEYEERTAHLQENTTSLLSAISDRQVQAAGLATQAYSLAAEANAVAEQASLSFSKKTWEDNATSGTPITAAELNRLENAISNLTTAVNNLQDSVSLTVLYSGTWSVNSTIQVTDASKYKVFVIHVTGWGDPKLLCIPQGTTFNAFAVDCWATNSADNMAVSAMRINRNGDAWKLLAAGRVCVSNNYAYAYNNSVSIITVM